LIRELIFYFLNIHKYFNIEINYINYKSKENNKIIALFINLLKFTHLFLRTYKKN
jgi:hypothetical protein